MSPPAISQQPKILLADDHSIVLESLQQILKEQYRIVGACSQGQTIMQEASRLKPDCLLLDISMVEVSGFDIARQLKQKLPQVKIIFVTMYSDPTFVREAFRIGADGYVLKQSAASELRDAIDTVLNQHRYISTHLPVDVQETAEIVADGIPTQDCSGVLTDRQQEVLSLLAKGYPSLKIARSLGISLSTVAFHKTNIMRSLGVRTSAELTKWAVSQGFSSLKSENESKR